VRCSFADHQGTSRKASKEVRRHQLIEATIDTLAKKVMPN
jgi:hypothetical protein